MSDFIYHSEKQPAGNLASCIRGIYHRQPPEVSEYHGVWGSLAVSRNPYNGFQAMETEDYVIVVVGGPVLTFRDNLFLTGDEHEAGTEAILERIISGTMNWDRDLSGPFVILVVDKVQRSIRCMTDLMLFIPAYESTATDVVALGTHVDALARAVGNDTNLDHVSLADFLLNKVVTFPHTVYTDIFQLPPASITEYWLNKERSASKTRETYWTPGDGPHFKDINDAAKAVKSAVAGYIGRVTEGMNHVAQFLSGGEDSRAIAGLLPASLNRDGFIFLDRLNREGRIAHMVARAYNLGLTAKLRKPSHYLDILPEAADLIGGGQQCIHAHSLGFDKECRLDSYDAVFGGYLGETFLRAYDIRKTKIQRKLPFIPEFQLDGETVSRPLKSRIFTRDVLQEISNRRLAHVERLKEISPDAVHEWFHNWPRTMGVSSPNSSVNRRLFRSYEPFTCSEVVKISFSVPAKWKLNRKLFHLAFRETFGPSKWIPHSKGYYPYLPWWVNVPFRFGYWLREKVDNRLGGIREHEGPWMDWRELKKSTDWVFWLDICDIDFLKSLFGESVTAAENETLRKELILSKMFNLFQTRYLIEKKNLACDQSQQDHPILEIPESPKRT